MPQIVYPNLTSTDVIVRPSENMNLTMTSPSYGVLYVEYSTKVSLGHRIQVFIAGNLKVDDTFDAPPGTALMVPPENY